MDAMIFNDKLFFIDLTTGVIHKLFASIKLNRNDYVDYMLYPLTDYTYLPATLRML